MFSNADRQQIAELGITEKDVLTQLDSFKTGFPSVRLLRPCTNNDGIIKIQDAQTEILTKFFDEACAAGRVSVFVPASGAATRMFKSPLAVYNKHKAEPDWSLAAETESLGPEDRDVLLTLSRIHSFAFWPELKEKMNASELDTVRWINAKQPIRFLETLLTSEAMGYADLPKGLLLFHRYPDAASRTAFEEHVWEAALYAFGPNSKMRLHFTVSSEHEKLFFKVLEHFKGKFESRGCFLDITFSSQQSSTDTLAVDMNNEPFRDCDGRLVFRPAGHGALLKNLEAFGGDIVFIKNIDNIQPDHRKKKVAEVQKKLGGFLIEKQTVVFELLSKMQHTPSANSCLEEAADFLARDFDLKIPAGLSSQAKRDFLFKALNRPMRVCGMVKNQGEPGGGPFWVEDELGGKSRQIVEKSQVDLNSADQVKRLEKATHFNPVNLVCGLRDYQGGVFDLTRFIDPKTGFISTKSKEGKPLRALELPGLWNGAMAGWLTYFIETPAETFAPVKELNDLLRPEHQPPEAGDDL